MRTDRIGDVILTLPMARVLKRCRPGAHVAMLIHAYTSDLVKAEPEVDQVISLDSGSPPIAATVSELRRSRFDVVFHTNPRPRLALITALTGIPVRVGTGYRWYSFLYNRRVYEHRKDARRHELEYNLNLLRAVGCAEPWGDVRPRLAVGEGHAAAARRALADAGVPNGAKLAILHPGSGASARDWSPANFGSLATMLAAHEGVSVLVTGGAGEEELVAKVLEHSPPSVRSMVGKLGILEYAALAKMASVFVANSTGPLHVAAAVGTPVVGLYPQISPLSATRWGPWAERKAIFTPEGFARECSGCDGMKGMPCACMDSIDPGKVHDAAMGLLTTEAAAA